jgi:spore germination cell wall hydrolase CwlJ-like protein
VNLVRVGRHVAAALQRRDSKVGVSAVSTFSSRLRSIADSRQTTVALLGLGMLVGFPSAIAYQDMTSMISGVDAGSVRWAAVVQKSVVGSVQAADMPFVDKSVTGSIAGGGVSVPGIGKVAFTGKAGALDPRPDEARVVRSQKKGRIMQIAPTAPPRAFNAGSILERSSSLLRPSIEGDGATAFARAADRGNEVELAAMFQIKRERPKNYGVPDYLVALVNNDKPDILATAYAPASLAASPFDALLQNDPNYGRFIPPSGKGDHGWMSQPLPASVFTPVEQQCLAEAVYFEARGESLEGQAAVAQVVLNRVRNPTYPNTICGVVYQNKGWFKRCQFSFACDGVPDRISEPEHYRKARDIAMAVTAGKIFLSEVGSSTHYYAQYVSPGWARAMKRMTKIGLHIFYRTKKGGWS